MKNKFGIPISLIILVLIIIGSVYIIDKLNVGKEDIVVVVMDTWETFPWEVEDANEDQVLEHIEVWRDWWYGDVQENVQNELVPFLMWARENEITVVFSNMVVADWDYQMNSLTEWRKYNEPIINLTDDLDTFLKAKGVKRIYYVGYATNNCIIGKPTGMKAMSESGYDVVLLEDCSLSGAFQQLNHEEAIEYIWGIGEVTTSEEVKAEFGR